MTATPEAVATFTRDGISLTKEDPLILTRNREAQDTDESEVEMFFDNAADGQAMLDERFAILSQASPIHEGIEVDESLELGSAIPIAPAVPRVTIIDDSRDINTVARVRAFSYDTGSERYSVEVLE